MLFALALETKHHVGVTLLWIATTLVVTLVVQLIVHGTISRIVRRIVRPHYHQSQIEERKREDTLVSIFKTASSLVLWLIAIVVVLSEAHVNIAALLTGAGLIGVILGLGAQSTIKSYLAGIFIITENQYRVGDVITLNGIGITDGISGVVEDITIRITRLRDLDGNLHIITNGTANVITNRTFRFANINIDLNIGYDADIAKVESVINEVGATMAEDPNWQDAISEPIKFLRVDSFNESSVTIKSVGKVKAGSQWDVAGEFRRRILKAFALHKLEFQFPQVVVHTNKPTKS